MTKIPVLPTSCAYPPVPRFPLPSLFFLPPSNSESIVCPSSLVTSHITIISQFVHARHLHQESQSITMVSAHDAYRFSLSIVRNWHCNGYECIGLFPTFSSPALKVKKLALGPISRPPTPQPTRHIQPRGPTPCRLHLCSAAPHAPRMGEWDLKQPAARRLS